MVMVHVAFMEAFEWSLLYVIVCFRPEIGSKMIQASQECVTNQAGSCANS